MRYATAPQMNALCKPVQSHNNEVIPQRHNTDHYSCKKKPNRPEYQENLLGGDEERGNENGEPYGFTGNTGEPDKSNKQSTKSDHIKQKKPIIRTKNKRHLLCQ